MSLVVSPHLYIRNHIFECGKPKIQQKDVAKGIMVASVYNLQLLPQSILEFER